MVLKDLRRIERPKFLIVEPTSVKIRTKAKSSQKTNDKQKEAKSCFPSLTTIFLYPSRLEGSFAHAVSSPLITATHPTPQYKLRLVARKQSVFLMID